MNTKIRYTIPVIPPSINKYIGRNNVYEYRREKAKWKSTVSIFCRPRPKEPIKKARMTIVFYFPDNRGRDYDNYLKMLLDGLTGAGIIADDNFKTVPELVLSGTVDRKAPRIEIEITTAN